MCACARVCCVPERGQSHVLRINHCFTDRLSLLHICFANGTSLPPILTVKGKQMTDDMFDGLPDDSALIMTDSGYFTAANLLDVFKHIERHAPPHDASHPLVMFLDQCNCHMDLEALNFAHDHHIFPFFLPSHTTHLLQVSDLACFRSFKVALRKAIDAFLLKEPTTFLSKHNLGPMIHQAWIAATNKSNVISGFRAAGIHPFDRSRVTEEQLEATHPTLPSHPPSRPLSPAPILPPQQLQNILFTPATAPPPPPKPRALVIDSKGGMVSKQQVQALKARKEQEEQERQDRKNKPRRRNKQDIYRLPAHQLRELIALSQTLLPLDTCWICLSQEGDGEWICCDRCRRWMHFQCIELQANRFRRADVIYICPLCLLLKADVFHEEAWLGSVEQRSPQAPASPAEPQPTPMQS